MCGVVYSRLASIIDITSRLECLAKDATPLNHAIQSLESKLGNANFVNKAPTAVVDKTKQQLEAQRQALATVIRAIQKSNESLLQGPKLLEFEFLLLKNAIS